VVEAKTEEAGGGTYWQNKAMARGVDEWQRGPFYRSAPGRSKIGVRRTGPIGRSGECQWQCRRTWQVGHCGLVSVGGWIRDRTGQGRTVGLNGLTERQAWHHVAGQQMTAASAGDGSSQAHVDRHRGRQPMGELRMALSRCGHRWDSGRARARTGGMQRGLGKREEGGCQVGHPGCR
jgi:hypothetical protein